MRRKDREIKNKEEIIDILRRCDTIRIGLQGELCPYVIPVSFGFRVSNGIVTVYFHSARFGHKVELLTKNQNVCIEGDIFDKVEPTEHGITARYESIIGFGTAEIVPEEEKIRGLQSITEHYNFADYPVGRCKGLENTAVYKITLSEITGKRNKVEAQE